MKTEGIFEKISGLNTPGLILLAARLLPYAPPRNGKTNGPYCRTWENREPLCQKRILFYFYKYQEMLELIEFAFRDTLYVLGDVIDRGRMEKQ